MYNLKDLHFSTERLYIRPITVNDRQGWLEGFNNRHPSQYRHDKGKVNMDECDKDWFFSYVKNIQNLIKNDDTYIFGLFLKNGQHIGMADIKILSRSDFQWGECGYFLHNQFWGNGYAYEAMHKIIEQCLDTLQLHRIEAHINVDNEPSKNLIKKLGFKYECTREKFIYEFDEWTDNEVYFINLHNERIIEE
ncbi:GNAT family N-acetyltransferase [Mammaliicoccus stepanovicii]|uniref:Acetyltransferase n=1 Tax=Mammaliicoccus stepanovicii TaxID=643214 RepID=A0A240A840_9STAP|nr:GNAT family N-acetyltransferase [Mammaliicoccus stepanovicii]PNZ78025.1 GNAT family N-acetyltransferase [Mammaliicoccus stepanovicii]GGI39621.1 acetyltransferase [Mammaliicoccus stepanovicii]SNV79056.1 acetyltransferase [Mammaliicoccus stepanovicii]